MPDFTGQDLGRYHIIEKLGEGGMAIVYRAYDTSLDIDVAIKFVRTERLAPEFADKARKRFKIEAQKTAKLMHASIVPVIDYGDYKGVPYLVMRYVEGGKTLKSILGKSIHWHDSVKLLLPIAQALDFAHKNQIIHRDVKPANILVASDGSLMLTDFGIAKVIEVDETMDGLTTAGMAIGTPEYMAPEQWEGGKVDGRADIYALGVVFYEMITGRPPFKADTVPATMVQVLRDPLPRPKQFIPDLPDEVEKLLFKALAKNPEDRLGTMQEFALELLTLAIKDPNSDPRLSLSNFLPLQSILPVNPEATGPLNRRDSAIIARPKKEWWFVVLGVIILFIIFFFSFYKKSLNEVLPELGATSPTEKIDLSTCENVPERNEKFYSLKQDGESNNINCTFSTFEKCRIFSGITWNDLENSTIGATKNQNGSYTIQRSILYFDTSNIPDCAIIHKISLSLHFGPFINNDSHFEIFPIEKQENEFPIPSVESIMWISLGSGYATNPDEWITIDLDTLDPSWINLEGISSLAIVHNFEYSKINPEKTNDLTINMSESKNSPYLTIIYSNP